MLASSKRPLLARGINSSKGTLTRAETESQTLRCRLAATRRLWHALFHTHLQNTTCKISPQQRRYRPLADLPRECRLPIPRPSGRHVMLHEVDGQPGLSTSRAHRCGYAICQNTAMCGGRGALSFMPNAFSSPKK